MCTNAPWEPEANRIRQNLITRHATLKANDASSGNRASCTMPNQISESGEPVACEDMDTELQQAWDDVSGTDLDSGIVRTAGAEEMRYIKKTDLYTKVPRSKAQGFGKKIIAVRWGDANKGDTENANYRSRLVAKASNHSL